MLNYFLRRCGPTRAMVSSFMRFLDHTQRLTTVGRTPLDEWSSRRRDLYLTTQHSQQTNIHAPGGIRTHNVIRRAAADLRLIPRGPWDRHCWTITKSNSSLSHPYRQMVVSSPIVLIYYGPIGVKKFILFISPCLFTFRATYLVGYLIWIL